MSTDATTLAHRSAGKPVFNHARLTLSLTLPGLRTSDGHSLDAYATLSVRLLSTPADLELFDERLFAGRDTVTLDDVRRRLAGPLATSLGEFAAGHDVDTCLRQHAAVETLLLRRCEAIGFGCGLAFEVVDLRLDSPSRQRELDRRHADAERLRTVRQAAAVATTLRTLGPDAAAAADRPALFMAHLRAAAARPWRAVMTAGRNVLTLGPDGDLAVTPAPEAVGSLRCVRRIDGGFALGGQAGVCLSNDRFETQRVFAAAASGRGFNSVVRLATGEVIAAHGETGLSVWTGAGAARQVVPPGPARLLTRTATALLLAVGGQAYALDGDAIRAVGQDRDTILALCDLGVVLAVVRQDGTVDRLHPGTLGPLDTIDTIDTGARRTAAGVVAHGDAFGLLLDGPKGIDAVDAEGVSLARFNTRPAGLRMLAAAGGHLLGVTADRSTLVVWDAAAPREPVLMVNVLARTGNHVTDLWCDAGG